MYRPVRNNKSLLFITALTNLDKILVIFAVFCFGCHFGFLSLRIGSYYFTSRLYATSNVTSEANDILTICAARVDKIDRV